jgi:hypothetical protein
MSHDEDYKPPGDSADIWGQTSRWRQVQLDILKLYIGDGNECDIVGTTDIFSIELYADSTRLLLPCDNVRDNITNLSREQKIFFNRLLQLTIFDDEPPVDAVASDLLTYSGFESDNIHFRPRPRLRFTCLSHHVTSIPDYGVFIDRSVGPPANEYLVVVEDKAPGDYERQYRECQLCGEMLASAINRYSDRHSDKLMFGVIISGLEIRFYKVIFSRSYLESVVTDRVPPVRSIITRFPSANEFPLSLNKKHTRERIVRMLHAIRIQLEQIIINPMN